MRLPREIRVGSVRYAIRSADLSNKWGETDHEQQVIDIAKGMAVPMRARTLAHEALHTLFHASGLSSDRKIEALEERIVSGLEAPFAELIANNPQFVKYITEALKR